MARLEKAKSPPRSYSGSITGRIDKGNAAVQQANVNKLIDFRIRLQRSGQHPHGIIGLLIGNSTNFNTDPDASGPLAADRATKGLMLGRTEIGYQGRVFKRLSFRATLYFGGEHETVVVT